MLLEFHHGLITKVVKEAKNFIWDEVPNLIMRKVGSISSLESRTSYVVSVLIICATTLSTSCLANSPSLQVTVSPVANTSVPTSVVLVSPTAPAITETATPCVEKLVAGYVIGGGDTTQGGQFDVPRKFVYEVKTKSDAIIKIQYTAFPPTPGGVHQEIVLEFYAGEVMKGDYLKAYGCYDKGNNTLLVIKKGDYIETFPEKP